MDDLQVHGSLRGLSHLVRHSVLFLVLYSAEYIVRFHHAGCLPIVASTWFITSLNQLVHSCVPCVMMNGRRHTGGTAPVRNTASMCFVMQCYHLLLDVSCIFWNMTKGGLGLRTAAAWIGSVHIQE